MRVAVAVFGISRYAAQELNEGQNRLQYASEDAHGFADYARAAFSEATALKVFIATDSEASDASWYGAIEDLATAQPDLFICYLAGHGIRRHSGSTWFCLHDADLVGGSDVGFLSGAHIDRAFERIGAARSILFLDCCYAEGVITETSYFRKLSGDYARLYLVSARADQRAWEDDALGHGLFSNAVLRALADGSSLAGMDGYVNLDSLFGQVSEEVAARAFSRKNGVRQEPISGGATAAPVRMPTASRAALADQFSTYDALALGLRRWLQRAFAAFVAMLAVTDLSFQHLAVDSEGNIVARSGLHLFNPLRRTLPGGEIDTGLNADELAPREAFDPVRRALLREGRLHVNRLQGLDGWPARLGPLLQPSAKAELSLLLSGDLPEATDAFASPLSGPPLDALAALMAFSPERPVADLARKLGYRVPEAAFDCSEDVSNVLDFNHLNPRSAELVAEIDWRLALAEDRVAAIATAARIVAYRLNVVLREDRWGTGQSEQDPAEEFAQVGAWAAGRMLPVLDPNGWCRPAALLLDAVGADSERSAAAEQELIETVKSFDPDRSGDLAPPDVEIALDLLEIVARHRELAGPTIEAVAAILQADDRGLNGPPIFAQWLSAVAPHTPFPESVRGFLRDALSRPETEFEFRQITAFEILAKNARYLDKTDHAQLLAWRSSNASEFGAFDAFASGIAHLAPFLGETEVRQQIDEIMARTSSARALLPPEATWRGDMLISVSDLPEWTAITLMAQGYVLGSEARARLTAFAVHAPCCAPRRSALLAVAHQSEGIRSRDWSAFRRALAAETADAERRNLLADAAAARICSDPLAGRRAAAEALRILWARERTPVIRLGLARALQGAARCELTYHAGAATLK